jgi:hypothetical protein
MSKKQNKTKAMVQNRKKISAILPVNDHGTEMVSSFKCLGTVINITNDETKEIKAGIMTANKADCSVHTAFRFKQIQRNYKKHQSGQYCVTKCTLDPDASDRTSDSKPSSTVYGPVTKGHWRSAGNSEIYGLADDMKIGDLRGAAHTIRMDDERIKKKCA